MRSYATEGGSSLNASAALSSFALKRLLLPNAGGRKPARKAIIPIFSYGQIKPAQGMRGDFSGVF
jgi:hypothetical protein